VECQFGIEHVERRGVGQGHEILRLFDQDALDIQSIFQMDGALDFKIGQIDSDST